MPRPNGTAAPAKANGTPAGDGPRDDPATLLEGLSPEARRWVEEHPVTPDPEPPPVRTSTIEFTTVIGNPKPKVRSKDEPPPRRGDLVLTWAKDLREKPVDWLWQGRIPAGMVTLISGDKGAGKSSLACWIAAAVSAGRPLPGDAQGVAGRVLYLNAEEDGAKVWRPRLRRYGADLANIALVDHVKLTGPADAEPVPFSFVLDLPSLRETIARLANIRLIVVDTISSYLLSIDASSGADVRRVLEPLKRVAEGQNVAIVLNNHMNKGAGTKALYRSKDSIDLPNLARMTWLLAPDPDDRTRRILAPSSCNFTPAPALALAIDPAGGLAFDPEPLEGLDADGLLAREAHHLARAGRTPAIAAGKTARAQQFLLDRLRAGGAARKVDLQAQAAAEGYPESTFNDAVKKLRAAGSIAKGSDAEGRAVLKAAPDLLPEDGK